MFALEKQHGHPVLSHVSIPQEQGTAAVCAATRRALGAVAEVVWVVETGKRPEPARTHVT